MSDFSLHRHDYEICAARIRGRPWVANSAWLLNLCGSGPVDYQCVNLVVCSLLPVMAMMGGSMLLVIVGIVGIVAPFWPSTPGAYMYASTTQPISFKSLVLTIIIDNYIQYCTVLQLAFIF